MSRVCQGGAATAGSAIAETQLPIFPASSCAITLELAFDERDGLVVYRNGHRPVCSHPAADLAAFRFFTSQLIANGAASLVQIARAFAVPLSPIDEQNQSPSSQPARRSIPCLKRSLGRKGLGWEFRVYAARRSRAAGTA